MFWRASSLFRMDDCAAAVPAYEELIARARRACGPGEPVPDRHLPGPARQHGSAAAAFQRTVERYEHNRWSDAAADRLREIHHARAGTAMTACSSRGDGFIGSALVPRLVQAGYVPRLLVRRAPPGAAASDRVTVGDVTDVETLRLALKDVPP
jgi:hypothetical protein